MALSTKSVLILDDDPEHLKIYGWVVQRAGFAPVACLVPRAGLQLDPKIGVDLVLLDYFLQSDLSTEEIARIVGATWPTAPLVLLSDVQGLPAEMSSHVHRFIRKGEPAKLIETLIELLGNPEVQPIAS